MSYFGRNIRKIRIAKNISQAVFADLFKLTRSSIGAYEEGRAEAKLDTIIEIADYFRLTLDQLLKKELTINEIYRIREHSAKLESSVLDQNHDEETPLIQYNDIHEFIKKYKNNTYLQNLKKIKLPGLLKDCLAFEFIEEMGYFEYFGIRCGDLLIAYPYLISSQNDYSRKQLFIVLSDNCLCLARYKEGQARQFECIAFRTNSLIICEESSIQAQWLIHRIVGTKIPFSGEIETRLDNIETQIKQLINNTINKKDR